MMIYVFDRVENIVGKGPIITVIELMQNLVVMYIFTKFGADWLIIVDASVYTKSNVAIFLIQG